MFRLIFRVPFFNVAAAIAVLFTWFAMSCSAVGTQNPSSTVGHERRPLVFSYVKSNQVGIVKDGHITVRQNINVDSHLEHGDFAWSGDGRYFAVFNSAGTVDYNNRSLYMVDSVTSDVRSVPCPRCVGVAAAGPATFITAQYPAEEQGPSRFEKVELRGADWSDPAPFDVKLPSPLRSADLITGGKTGIIAMTDGIGSTQDSRLYRASSDAAPTLIEQSNSPTFRVGPRAAGPGGEHQQFALNILARLGGCGADVARIDLVDSVNGEVDHTDTSAVVPNEKVSTTGLGFDTQGLWWQGGKLFAAFYDWDCSSGKFPDQPLHPPTTYRLDGRHWSKVDDTPSLVRLDFGNGSLAWLAPRSNVMDFQNFGDSATGDLIYHDKTGDRTLAKDVMTLFVAPY